MIEHDKDNSLLSQHLCCRICYQNLRTISPATWEFVVVHLFCVKEQHLEKTYLSGSTISC